MRIEVRNLRKTFGNFEAVKGVSFRIESGRLVGLLGPSGSGKTTILRMLAGLETPDSGDVLFDGRRVNDVPPRERGIGFVFQNYALFRHMSVFDNIAFGLTVKKKNKAYIRERVHELIKLTGLEGLEKRLPHQLSGGQRQRVAFARALAPEPDLLLLDEPFAAIDAKVRKELRSWLKAMIAKVGITTIFVTHDQEEAVELADELLILHQGKLEQQGSPLEIYQLPASPFVAGFVGESVWLEEPSRLGGFAELVPEGVAGMVRPEFVELGAAAELSHPQAAEQGTVKQVTYLGKNWQVEAEVSGMRVVGYRSLEQKVLKPGDPVRVLIHRLYVFDASGCRLVENRWKSRPVAVQV